ncbi:hypothetical protein BVRB_5g120480 [Beta vulgaris subsp. vulgaris]|nr:hypothetical protein BVRB_5g120480 [Beta vulgaris subsp. vulgaris]
MRRAVLKLEGLLILKHSLSIEMCSKNGFILLILHGIRFSFLTYCFLYAVAFSQSQPHPPSSFSLRAVAMDSDKTSSSPPPPPPPASPSLSLRIFLWPPRIASNRNLWWINFLMWNSISDQHPVLKLINGLTPAFDTVAV